MVTLAAIGLLIAAVIAFLVFDHSDELRDFFGFSDKTIVPPLNFSQWTIAALLTATAIVLVVTFGLGLVNAMHRLTCNARDDFDLFRGDLTPSWSTVGWPASTTTPTRHVRSMRQDRQLLD